ncbi:DUF1345 domain-containing protein [Solitalea sp. MAHUQ-68]|uniref:DUF1345 domain-containing protein n=1 Tax=Solitalea agri TaxID=2953739 RepID=A0A9X2JEL3_9SPHI|nr:DUF1345 domain-containing protein [Solitalea agri]MCO4292511.1 DUF1345 domain-containing protein [Solitalea agri]
MSANKKVHYSINALLKPLHRVLISLLFSLAAFFIFKNAIHSLLILIVFLWDIFAFSFVASSWIVFFSFSVDDIKHHARQEDGSRIFVFVIVLLSSFASMFTVLLLMLSKDYSQISAFSYLIIVIVAILSSWSLVHTTFTFHYAKLFYNDDEMGSPVGEGLEFPKEKKPDYIDFAYFSFVIGMTFQVSDVEISSRIIRRTALLHGLLSFCLNTFVVALTINIIAGLNK